MSTEASSELSDTQRSRIERNRQRALLLRSARVTSHPYNNELLKHSKQSGKRVVDTGGGFFIDAEDDVDEVTAEDLVEQPPPILDDACKDMCKICTKKFDHSKLLKDFDVNICDGCRNDDLHKLITRTEAKQKYCLKDCDFDMREPPLKFIVRKNPHNERWGDMKLYFEQQVHARAMVVWENEEKLEEQKEMLEVNKDKKKTKKFQKQIKDLRQSVRTSIWHKDLSKHTHEYDSENETYDEDEDMYTKKCKTCDHTVTYEKM